MSVRGDNCPVQILRSPEPRPRELQVVGFSLDAATAPLATPAAHRSLRSYSLPPSPPYTNPHLRRAIPLPLLDEIASRNQSVSMEGGKDGDRRMLFAVHGPASLLSPPYSPRRRALSLTTLDEKGEEPVPSSSTELLSADSDVHKWGESEDVFDESEPPMLKMKDLYLGEESDDWDEPLFLNAPSAYNGSDSLSLNLFGAVYSSDDEGLENQSSAPPSSPTIRSSSLPDFDRDPREKSRPLFAPSDFDVFENGWDTITDSTQSGLLSPTETDTVLNTSCDQSLVFHDSMEPSFLPAPSSPSRRNVVGLPGDDHSDRLTSGSFMRSRALIVDEDDDLAGKGDQLFGPSYLPRKTISCSHKHQPFDVPTEVIQTPFNIPLSLPSYVSRAPPADSLLFATLEPQDIPLPDSPQSPILQLQGDYVVPPLMHEENRIRRLHLEMLKAEAEARAKEALLTEYIARLNAMKPPPLPIQVPVYYPRRQIVIVGCDFTEASGESSPDMEHWHIEEQQTNQSPLHVSLSSAQGFSSSQASMTLEFLQARRKEVQNAVALRAAERRHRKLIKERVRELDALLQLKTGQLRPLDTWALAAPRGRRGRNDEAIVLAASGSDRHLAHTNAMLRENTCEPETSRKVCQEGIRQLVAKMVFRRRDTSRPLSGKNMPTLREYVRSGLSQAINFEEHDDDVISSNTDNVQLS